MKVHALTGSKWCLGEKEVDSKDKDGQISKKMRQQLFVELQYPSFKDGKSVREANGELKFDSTYSFIPVEDGVVKPAQTNKRGMSSFDGLQTVADQLKEGHFDVCIQKGQKGTTASIIGACLTPEADPRMLVLGGFTADSIWYDSVASRKISSGVPSNGTVFRFCQVFQDEEFEGKPRRNVTEVQFAALLDEGEKVVYHLTKITGTGRRKTINVTENKGGLLRQQTYSLSQWKELHGDTRYQAPSPKDVAAPRE